jgi:hypothetical protein
LSRCIKKKAVTGIASKVSGKRRAGDWRQTGLRIDSEREDFIFAYSHTKTCPTDESQYQ